GGLATFVSAATLVDGLGEVRRYTRDDPELGAAALGLGALGVLTDVTVRCVPAFRLHADERPMPLDRVTSEFDAMAEANDHFEFYWFPRADRALVKRNNRAESGEPLSRLRRWLDDEFLSNRVFAAACGLARAVPATVPAVTWVSSRALSARTYVDQSHGVFCTPRRVRFVEMEYAVPRAAFAEVFAGLRRAADRRAVVFPVEVRTAAADELWLSTSHGRDSVYFGVHQYVGMPFQEFFDEVEAVMLDHGGRPHWGKLHSRTAADLAGDYPRFGDFTALRDRLDPGRVFANDYLRRVLGE
ncbi:MAG: D-arabinono-1,4-lactone oxidase, partial [Stackebrandtia sp.]